MELEFVFSTDTATVVLFDPEAVEHRKKDRADWWSNPFEELEELNAGNLVLFDLAQDGEYVTKIVTESGVKLPATCAKLKCISGSIHVGPGETLPGGGRGPSKYGGGILDLAPGVWIISARRLGDYQIELRADPTNADAKNKFLFPLSIDEPNTE